MRAAAAEAIQRSKIARASLSDETMHRNCGKGRRSVVTPPTSQDPESAARPQYHPRWNNAVAAARQLGLASACQAIARATAVRL